MDATQATLATVGFIVSLLGLLVTIAVPLYLYWQRHPLQQVSYQVQQQPTVADPGAQAHLSAVGLERSDLVLVSLSLWASGRADIPSSAFDAGRPIVFEFVSPIADSAMPKQKFDIEGWGFTRLGINQLILNPCLIGRGVEFRAQAVVAAPGEFRMRHPLTNVAVVRDAYRPRGLTGVGPKRKIRVTVMRVGVALLVVGFVFNIVGTVLVYASSVSSGILLVLGWLLAISGLITVIASGIARLRARVKHTRPPEKPGIPDAPEPATGPTPIA